MDHFCKITGGYFQVTFHKSHSAADTETRLKQAGKVPLVHRLVDDLGADYMRLADWPG